MSDLGAAAAFEVDRAVKGVISRSRGAAVVFVDDSTEERSADHGAGSGRCSRYRLGWCGIEASVGSVPVVVLDVLLVGCENSIAALSCVFAHRRPEGAPIFSHDR
jgi:hypothetical protein